MCKGTEENDDWTPLTWEDLRNGDCWEVIKTLEDTSVDAIITDPPYDINFMGKDWDKNSLITNTEFWKECLRVLKPGGHLLAFGHSRTSHRMVSAVEDAGFQIRDTIMWIYGSGFPKSHNVGKGVDKKLGNERKKIGEITTHDIRGGALLEAIDDEIKKSESSMTYEVTTGNSEWEGWGSALKPAHEPVVLARKPLEGTIVDNVLKHGVGALNIDATRIASDDKTAFPVGEYTTDTAVGKIRNTKRTEDKNPTGRWAANVILGHHEDCKQVGEKEEKIVIHNAPAGTFAGGEPDRGSEKDYRSNTIKVPVWKCVDGCPVKELDSQSGIVKTGVWNETDGARHFENNGKDTGYKTKKKPKETPSGASKFFYCPKVGKKERNAGLDGEADKNNHPTVKPIALMEYLIKLVTKQDAIVLDPFMGSGTTGIAAKNLYRNFIGIEREQAYYDIAHKRIGVEDED